LSDAGAGSPEDDVGISDVKSDVGDVGGGVVRVGPMDGEGGARGDSRRHQHGDVERDRRLTPCTKNEEDDGREESEDDHHRR